MRAFRPVLGGTAAVYCVHDRQKAQVVTEAQVVELGREHGQVFDPRQHKLHRCACCRNLFVDLTDLPRLCGPCLRPTVHTLEAPLPEPTGEVDG